MKDGRKGIISEIIKLDRIIHEPARIALLSILSVVRKADFLYLKNATGLTQGNLSTHLKTLQKAGYINITKTYKGNRPYTLINMTGKGESSLEDYIKTMKSLLLG